MSEGRDVDNSGSRMALVEMREEVLGQQIRSQVIAGDHAVSHARERTTMLDLCLWDAIQPLEDPIVCAKLTQG